MRDKFWLSPDVVGHYKNEFCSRPFQLRLSIRVRVFIVCLLGDAEKTDNDAVNSSGKAKTLQNKAETKPEKYEESKRKNYHVKKRQGQENFIKYFPKITVNYITGILVASVKEAFVTPKVYQPLPDKAKKYIVKVKSTRSGKKSEDHFNYETIPFNNDMSEVYRKFIDEDVCSTSDDDMPLIKYKVPQK
ncbi:hypothetical protein ACJJTC_000343 [Scirpophaga incertulas]